MILYISAATTYKIYDRQFEQGLYYGSSPAQKFNNVLISGLANQTETVSLSALLYKDVAMPRIEEIHDGIRYICIENKKGRMRRINNVFALFREGKRLIRNGTVTNIICDAISVSPAIASHLLGKRYHIPVTAIVTDIPNIMNKRKAGMAVIIDDFFMKRFDSYVLLTRQMNEVVNTRKKPFIVMEGICSDKYVEGRRSLSPRTILYTGALWKKDLGIEYFTEGFIKANLEGYELHFYGQGEAVEWIEEISRKHPNVKYMGVVTNEEVLRKQAEASLLVNPRPSDREFTKYSFPSKTMEYMLSGTPVLMTRLAGVPEEYYKYVYTIDDETVDGAAATLKKVLSDPGLFATGLAAQKYVIENKSARIQSKRVYDFVSAVSKGDK